MRGDSGGCAPDVMGEIQTGRSLHDEDVFRAFVVSLLRGDSTVGALVWPSD